MTRWHENKAIFTLLTLGLTLLPRVAFAEGNYVEASPTLVTAGTEAPKASPARGQRFLQMDFGMRKTFVKDGGYDTYSNDDVLTQGSLGASVTMFTRGRMSFAVGGRWDFGGSSASIRGAETSIYVHRLEGVVEARIHVRTWLYGFLRLAPGAMHARARLGDPSTPGDLGESRWMFVADVSLGGAVRLTSFEEGAATSPHLWVLLDVGYSWSPRSTSTLSPSNSEDDPRLYGDFNARSLALRGGFGRLALAMTF